MAGRLIAAAADVALIIDDKGVIRDLAQQVVDVLTNASGRKGVVEIDLTSTAKPAGTATADHTH